MDYAGARDWPSWIGGVWETLVMTARLTMQGVAKQIRLLPDPLLNPTPPVNCNPWVFQGTGW